MSRTLDVYLHERLVGYLVQDDHGRKGFTYTAKWAADPASVPLSHSLPLRTDTYTERECTPFFAGLLPDGDIRRKIALIEGISANNDFAMLEAIGGECAGAVVFLPSEELSPARNDRYRLLTDQELGGKLRELSARPLLAGEDGIRLSLAGAQDKMAVYMNSGRPEISLPLGSAPSTHILKTAIAGLEGSVANEMYCMSLAGAIGLRAAKTSVHKFDGVSCLAVERYDRIRRSLDGVDELERLHQEDFCQALGVRPDHKYQHEGGPSLTQIFALLREVSAIPALDLQMLLDVVIFNYLIGNYDAHGKNFSLLYDRGARLAPCYDLISTAVYPELSKKMAMKIDGEYEAERIRSGHFEQLAKDVDLSPRLVMARVKATVDRTIKQSELIAKEHPIEKKIHEIVLHHGARLISV